MVIRQSWYPPRTIQPVHEHEAGALTLVVRGGLVEESGRREESAEPLSLVVKPPGTRHSNRFGPDGAHLLQILFDTRHGGPVPGSTWGHWRWIHGGAAARRFLAVLEMSAAATSGHDELASRVVELIAEIMPGPDRETRRTPWAAEATAPVWLREACARLVHDLSSPVRVSELAREAGVHPVSFARAFRRHYGVPATSFARRRRVAAAAGELSRCEHDLADIAYLTGFADQAHFCRVFKSATGLTPARYRALTAS
jgi:AraC family transcriptional regulator